MRRLLLALTLLVPLALPAMELRFLAVDNGGNRLLLVDQHEPARSWSVAIPGGSRDLQLVDGGRVLVGHGNGCAEYDLATGARRWGVDRFHGVSSAQRLPGGTTLLAVADPPAALVEVAVDGSEVRRTPLAVPGANELRLARRLADGHTLVGLAAPHTLVEVDAAGAVVATTRLPGKGYVGRRLPDGHTLATTGETVTVVELDAAGGVVRELGGRAKHGAARLLWFSGFDLLPDGTVVVANWCGHGQAGKGPHAVAFNAANELVWQWEDHQAAKTVTNLLVLPAH